MPVSDDESRLIAYARLVADMRKAYRDYYKSRKHGRPHPARLQEAKNLQSKVDVLTYQILQRKRQAQLW